MRNFRLYFVGQFIGVSGIWMQQVAVAWLVLRLTNSAFSLGLAIALQTLPFLLVGPWGGLLVDRLPKRKMLICTQFLQMAPSIALWALYAGGSLRIWMVYALVLSRGVVNAFDNPARQSIVAEMVGLDRVVNAVSLNASLIQGGRLFGPAAAALIIATLGLGPCFLGAASTYGFMVVMLLLMRPEELDPVPVTPRGKGQLRAGIVYAARTPELRVPLVLMAIVGLLSFNFTVSLPALARFTYHGTATTYALMMNFLAAGALVGALVAGTRTVITRKTVSWAALAFGVALGVAAAVDNLWVALVALIAVGATSVTFSASIQSAVQLAVPPEMRGRILSLYQAVYQGTTPIGALIVGALASTAGARSALVLGSIGAAVAGAGGIWGRGSRTGAAAGTGEPSDQRA